MRVTIKNPTKKPINISNVAPMIGIQTLCANGKVIANVRDIEKVSANAKKLGLIVIPFNNVETDVVVESVVEKTGEPEIVEIVEETNDTPIVEDTKKVIKTTTKKPVKKSKKTTTKTKKTTTKKLFGNNK